MRHHRSLNERLIRVFIISGLFGATVTYFAWLIIEAWLRLMNAPI